VAVSVNKIRVCDSMEVSIHRAGPVSRVAKMTIHRASPVSNKNDYTQGRPCVNHRAQSIS